MDKKEYTLGTLLLRSLIQQDYSRASEIIKDPKFNPNEKNLVMESPILQMLVSTLGGLNRSNDNSELKSIIKTIVDHDDFNPNSVDANGDTPLMVIAKNQSFNWLAPFILVNKDTDITIKNHIGVDATEIAESFNNITLANVLLARKGSLSRKGLPKLRAGVKLNESKNTVLIAVHDKNSHIVRSIFNAFTEEQRKNEYSTYHVLMNFINGNYEKCLEIIRSENFNPCEYDRWDEPSLSSLIYYSMDSECTYEEKKYKQIVEAYLNHPKFDPNQLDGSCNSPIMVSVAYKKLNWLTRLLFDNTFCNIGIKNDLGWTFKDIARESHNFDFYKSLVYDYISVQ